MSIIKVHKQKNFSIISNIPLNDKSISFKAKGIWAYLMSKPEDWEVRISNLINTSTEGRDAIYSGIKELVNAGYMNKIQHRDESGKMTGIEYQVFEDPVNRPLEPVPENPDSGNRDSDNRTQLNTETKINTDDDKQQAPPEPDQTPHVDTDTSSSSDYEKDLIPILASLITMVPEAFRKPSVEHVIKSALEVNTPDYIRAAIAYTIANSTGGTLPKFKAYLGRAIDLAWAVGWEPETDQADPEARAAAFLESRRGMPDSILKSDAANGCRISEQVLAERRARGAC